MPSLPRRALIRTLGLSGVALLAGCNSQSDGTGDTTPTRTTTAPSPERESPTDTATPPETETQTETETPHPEELDAGAGPLPATVWPLPHRGASNGSYLPHGPQIESEPGVDWQVSPTTPPDQDHHPPDFTVPVIADGLLYTVNRLRATPEVERPEGHFLRAYDTTTGEAVWEYTVDHGSGTALPTPPAVGNGVVWVGQAERLHAVGMADGTEVESQQLPAPIDAIYPTRDRTYVTAGSSIVTVDPNTERIWTKQFETAPVTLAKGTDKLYAAVSRRVLALDPATGDPRWHKPLPAGGNEYTVNHLVTVAGGVLVLQHNGTLSTFTQTGTRGWRADGAYQSLSTDGSRVFAGMEDGLRALRSKTGERVWELTCDDLADCAAGSFFGKPAVTDSALYTSLDTGHLVAVRPTDATVLWSLEEPTGFKHLSLGSDALYGVGFESEPLVKLHGQKP